MIENFRDPLAEYRPVPFWSWNEKLNKKELLRQMRAMKRAGYGGFFMHSRVGLITRYLSDEWMEDVRFCAERAGELGLEPNLYDEDMWPSGYAAGAVPAAGADYREKALVLIDPAQKREDDEVVAAGAIKEKPYCICIRTAAVGNVRFAGQSYIDIFNPNAIQLFFHTTHDKYAATVGDLFGSKLKYIFSDEACYGIHWFYDTPHVTYSPYLRERFRKDNGYDILEKVHELFFETGDYRKTRYDYFRAASAQFNDSYTKQYSEYARKRGFRFTGHLMSEESCYEQVQWTGGVMPCYEYMSVPGIDKLSRVDEDQLVTIKQMTSVAEQLGKPRALSECFAGIGHESGFIGRKKIMDWQAVHGINYINMHLSHYSMRGERKRDYPPNIFYQQPYFAEEKSFSDYAARLSTVAAFGKRETRVLVLSPLYSVFAEYNPNGKENEKRLRAAYDTPFAALNALLEKSRIEWHIGDETILSRHAAVNGNLLEVGHCRYDTVVLPPVSIISSETAKLLGAFTRNGGRLFATGEMPSYIDGEPAELPFRAEKTTANSLARRLMQEGYSVYRAPEDDVIACVRVAGEERAALLVNRSAEERTVYLRGLNFRPDRVLSLSDGSVYRLPKSVKSFRLRPYGSVCLFLGRTENCKQLPDLTEDGAIFRERNYTEIEPYSVRALDENALPLDHARFSVDGKPQTDFVHVQNIWHYLFYHLEEGTPFGMDYRFTVETLPRGKVYAVIENAENLDSITVNGSAAAPMRKRGETQFSDDKCYKDVSFTRVEITGLLREGVNEIELRGKKINNITEVCCHCAVSGKHEATEADAIYIVGDFGVFERKGEYVIAETPRLKPGDISACGYPFYSGRIAYDFDGSARRILAEGDAVYVSCGKNRSHEPFILDVKGVSFTLVAYNTLYALLGPQYLRGYDGLRWVDPGVFNDKRLFTDDYLIKPFGLTKFKVLKGEIV